MRKLMMKINNGEKNDEKYEAIVFTIFLIALIINILVLTKALLSPNISDSLHSMRYIFIPAVIASIATGSYVFPTLQNFDWDSVEDEDEDYE